MDTTILIFVCTAPYDGQAIEDNAVKNVMDLGTHLRQKEDLPERIFTSTDQAAIQTGILLGIGFSWNFQEEIPRTPFPESPLDVSDPLVPKMEYERFFKGALRSYKGQTLVFVCDKVRIRDVLRVFRQPDLSESWVQFVFPAFVFTFGYHGELKEVRLEGLLKDSS